MFLVYATFNGDVFAVRTGDQTWNVIGNVKQFYIIKNGEIPSYSFSFSGNHPYTVTVHEETGGESLPLNIPRSITYE